eukprot:scaffold114885_cov63-Phaeocystis_antarctica.AAC.3
MHAWTSAESYTSRPFRGRVQGPVAQRTNAAHDSCTRVSPGGGTPTVGTPLAVRAEATLHAFRCTLLRLVWQIPFAHPSLGQSTLAVELGALLRGVILPLQLPRLLLGNSFLVRGTVLKFLSVAIAFLVPAVFVCRMLGQGTFQVRIGASHRALPRVAPWRARLQVDGGSDEAGPAAFAAAAQLVAPEHQLQAEPVGSAAVAVVGPRCSAVAVVCAQVAPRHLRHGGTALGLHTSLCSSKNASPVPSSQPATSEPLLNFVSSTARIASQFERKPPYVKSGAPSCCFFRNASSPESAENASARDQNLDAWNAASAF